MSRATVSNVSRPERYSMVSALSFPCDTASSLAFELQAIGARAWVCKRRGLVVLHGNRRLRLVSDPDAPPATLKDIVGLVESCHAADPSTGEPAPPKGKRAAPPEATRL